MNSMEPLDLAISQEQSIFRLFSCHAKISNRLTAFHAPDSNEVAHWDSAYPNSMTTKLTRDELALVKQYYKDHDKSGYILSGLPEHRDKSVDTNSYFALKESIGDRDIDPKSMDKFSAPDLGTLDFFSETIGKCFNLNEETVDFFRKKMVTIKKSVKSHFYVVHYDGNPCGVCSTFRTQNGSDFLFNVGVLPEFRMNGVASQMILFVASQAKTPLYTYTPNDSMRDSILPAAGFKFIGDVYTVPVSEYAIA